VGCILITMKNKLFIILLVVIISSTIVYAKGCLNSGAQVSRGDATEVCCTGYGLVNNCIGNQTCNDNVYCAGNSDEQNMRIITNMKKR